MPPKAPRVAVIVVAAGAGTRLGVGEPKAFVDLAGRSLLMHALSTASHTRGLASLIVVAPVDRLDVARASVAPLVSSSLDLDLDIEVVAGGTERQQSVANGLALVPDHIDTVLVHDAARPLTPVSQFDRVAEAVERLGHGVIPGLAVSDTIKRTDAVGRILETVDRSELSAVQTPQGFPLEQLRAAYAAATLAVTDDAALLAAIGHPVSVIPGDPLAFKVTTAADLDRARDIALRELSPTEQRIGFGSDTHAFGPEGTELWLAGLLWPGETGLSGHSDGDAVAHAITDALLSAAGLGDIGSNFGTADPRFAGAHGDVFLAETRRLLQAAGIRIVNVSAQIIGNRPRFSARRPEAEHLLSDVLGAPVTLSATTTDGLGFTGRGEGLTVISTALVQHTS